MNRLVLIGNGFELAHGLRTGYNDFLLWYLKQSLDHADNEGTYSDLLLRVINSSREPYSFSELKNTQKLLDYCYQYGSLYTFLEGRTPIFYNSTVQHLSNPYKVEFRSRILRDLVKKCSIVRWVDIEMEFYDNLKQFICDKNGRQEELIKGLNELMDYLVKKLNIYLGGIPLSEHIPEYCNILKEPIYRDEIVIRTCLMDDEMPKNTLLLNFNYTNTLEW